jgi:hypothetical protein
MEIQTRSRTIEEIFYKEPVIIDASNIPKQLNALNGADLGVSASPQGELSNPDLSKQLFDTTSWKKVSAFIKTHGPWIVVATAVTTFIIFKVEEVQRCRRQCSGGSV